MHDQTGTADDQLNTAEDQTSTTASARGGAGDIIRAYPDLTAQVEAVASGEISAVELLQDSLALAEEVGRDAGVFLCRFDEEAMAAAEDADRSGGSSNAGTRPGGLLAGVPVGIKPMIAVAETATTAQSQVFDPTFHSGQDAEVVARLRAVGAVIEGTTTMAEHAAGRPDPALSFPIPRNPWDLNRWPGGSSCGTAIGISLGIFAGGLGTDTSGSCRIPAAYCGITGLRPARGTVPMDGILQASPTLDVVGPMARSARDCRLLLDIMGGSEAAAGESPAQRHRLRAGDPNTVRRVGVPSQVLESDCIGSAVSTAFSRSLVDLVASGVDVEYVDLPIIDDLIATTMVIMVREMFEVHQHTLRTRWDDYGRSFRRLAVLGAAVPDAVYHRALDAATPLGARLDEALSGVDALALPTWPDSAPPYVFKGGTPQEEWNLTAAFCATGRPSLALPMGFDQRGLPLSLQLVGPFDVQNPHRGNSVILDIGEAFQTETDHHLHFAPIDPRARVNPIPDPDDGIADSDEKSADGGLAGGGGAFERLPESLKELDIPFDAADIATLHSLSRFIGSLS